VNKHSNQRMWINSPQLTAAHIIDQELICLESVVKPACSTSSPGVNRVLDTPRPVRIPVQINDSADHFYTLYSAILCSWADLLHSCQCDFEWVAVAFHSAFWISMEVVYLQCCLVVTNFHLRKMQLGLVYTSKMGPCHHQCQLVITSKVKFQC